MFKHCPGVKSIIAPRIIIRSCPSCGEEVEFFEYETQQSCPECGRIMYREPSETCISWCAYAKECIEELERKGLINTGRVKDLRKSIKQTESKT
jgi:predicted RNA-binding Zn-ribbon protein involved in translation (DUF1610 family)